MIEARDSYYFNTNKHYDIMSNNSIVTFSCERWNYQEWLIELKKKEMISGPNRKRRYQDTKKNLYMLWLGNNK